MVNKLTSRIIKKVMTITVTYKTSSQTMCLPVDEEELKDFMIRAYCPIPRPSEISVSFRYGNPNWIERIEKLLEDKNLVEINRIATLMDKIESEVQLYKLDAVCEYLGKTNIEEMCIVQKYLCSYIYFPRVVNEIELGREWSKMFGYSKLNIDKLELSQRRGVYYSYQLIGCALMDKYHGRFVSSGVVLRKGDTIENCMKQDVYLNENARLCVSEDEKEIRLRKFYSKNKPFIIYDLGETYCLQLRFSNVESKETGYNRYAFSSVSEIKDGLDWEKIFKYIYKDDVRFKELSFESNNDTFVCYSEELSTLEGLGSEFKAICDNTPEFEKLIVEILSEKNEEEN